MSDHLSSQDFQTEYISELQAVDSKYQEKLKENELMLNQLNLELNKLSELNRQKTAQLNMVKAQLDKMSKEDITRAYDEMIDSQRNMFIKKNQFEKLQIEKKNLEEILAFIENTKKFLEEGTGSFGAQRGTA